MIFGRWTPPVCGLFYFPSSLSSSLSISLPSHPSSSQATPHQPHLPFPASCTSLSSPPWKPLTSIAIDTATSREHNPPSSNFGQQQRSRH
ncbi:hypothetical protein SORBI_3001G242350 [Sorghum bicolor]|uniref:Uncharacterized protein n=1 Tax=Sorghum bicolor TaxID=4558 RepID=A0A1Z5S736_SORBI|nr:hypothetical protein SORBI_3001G242350 [Sorghum bicolor]